MGDGDGWIGGIEAAAILGVSRATIYRSLADPAERERRWGAEGVGWRVKPLSTRGAFQVSRARALELAGLPPDGPGDGR